MSIFANGKDVLHLNSVYKCKTTSELKSLISEKLNVNVSRQELYLGVELMKDNKTLHDYAVNNLSCRIALKCTLPVLISTLDCPGPMFVYVDVDYKNNETISSVKEKIQFKTGIEFAHQRMFLHPKNMTSFPRRQELKNGSLLLQHMSPASRDNFLELIVDANGNFGQQGKLLFIRLPVNSENFKENLKPEWMTIVISYESIIKKDPSISDVKSLLEKTLSNSKLKQYYHSKCNVNLKMIDHRTIYSENMQDNSYIFKDFSLRANEKLLYVADEKLGLVFNNSSDKQFQAVPPVHPLLPLDDYNSIDNIYTMPFEPMLSEWSIKPNESLDLGAKPRVEVEFSAVCYSRKFGSWDIAEHNKYYVEITVEGTCESGQLSDFPNLQYNNSSFKLTILGPEQPRGNNDILLPEKQIDKMERKNLISLEERDQKITCFPVDLSPIYFPSPIRFGNRREKCPPSKIEQPVSYVRPGRVEHLTNKWYSAKERVTNITLNQTNLHSTCKRGTNVLGRPYVTAVFNPKSKIGRKFIDFRVQALFFMCQKMNETNMKSVEIAIQLSHEVARVKKHQHLADEIILLNSPLVEKTILVSL